jgi:hypothetical protein
MKKLFVVLLILCVTTLSFAQEKKHTLTFKRGFFTNDYLIDGQEVSCSDFEYELARDYEAVSKWDTGNTMKYVSWGMAFGGGFLVGYGIAQGSQYGADQSYTFKLMAGGVLIVAAFIIERIGNSKKDDAVELYNKNIGKIAGNESVNLSLVPTEQGGTALAFNF